MKPTWWRTALVVAAALVAAWLRWHELERRAPFVDEAESAVNALTILQRGYPADRYLGLPVYENTLTEPWPESAEYEFRDSSYSVRGCAIYHGWLPLYAIAASCWAFGALPDPRPRAAPRVLHDEDEIERRILAARFPSILFSVLFVVALYFAGRAAYGADAGLAAAWVGALSNDCVQFGQQARYYSATLALATVAAFAVWRLRYRERGTDWLLAAIALAALFHTHVLAFTVVVALLAPRVVDALRAGRAQTVVPAMAVLAATTAPWLVFTGYFDGRGGGPPARELLQFPRDYVAYFAARPELAWSLALALLSGTLVWMLRRRLPRPAAAASRAALPALAFFGTWIVLAYAAFLLLMPAASAFFSRLTLALLPAGVLLVSVATAAGVRSLLGRPQGLITVTVLLLALVVSGRAFVPRDPASANDGALRELIAHLRALEIPAGTRLYSLPNQHLVLQWTTGLPVQSIAPVRREFLEHLPAEVILIESADPWPAATSDDVRRCASEFGQPPMSDAEARAWGERIRLRLRSAEIAPHVASVEPLPAADPPLWSRCVEDLLRARRSEPDYGIDYASHNPAMLRGCGARDFASFWPAFFYRFVGLDERCGARLNYAVRLAGARAHVLRSGWVVYRCPPVVDRSEVR